jgi:HAD superfamily hydrolase (TIGR01484 family)
VFTDIDDTLTTEGAITPDALQALHQLKDAGLMVIPITGRPVGWSMPFASTWPVDAVVAENGAVALFPDATQKQVTKIYQQDLATRNHNYQEMQRIAKRVLQEIPGTVMAQDSPGRETDIAFDHSEFHKLTTEQIEYYVDRYKPYDKAGSYAIQEWIGVIGIKEVSGDFYNVMGLPVSRVVQELQAMMS